MALWGRQDNEESKPKFLSDELRNDQEVSDKDSTYGVDAGPGTNYEAQLQVNQEKGLNTPGWVKYVTYTDSNGNVRHKSEVLVAMGSIQGDANDDAVLADD